VKITLDTEADDYGKALATIRAAYGISTPTGELPQLALGSDDPEGNQDFWTYDRLAIFAKGLADAAAEAVRYISANAPQVSLDDTMEHVGKHLGEVNFSGQQMGGRMASVGFSVKLVPGAMEPPFETDYKYRVYRMDLDVASALLEILGSPTSED
jgi:hypothetical protein